ncbi:hypothetical protein VYI41_07860 [Streptococcus anginosus]|uniref:hypothetical protein n=1 Tax=Streptococcus TaxID=1301 RepID=UPI0008A9CF54|nr:MULTISPECIES: hypothetical protein [Streptococcus]MCW1062274.1 hypothetical protein [Streptococcus anginosus]MCW1091113.1 hypothetical protein [Streptococcus anginosus]MED5788861.1 hypothetical protein [Streptococcus anginosus]MED5795033.1 hypothetical protein [Streptococcus anginosus]MED5796976.1 hypothetical protein [Streptococcus anginosus]
MANLCKFLFSIVAVDVPVYANYEWIERTANDVLYVLKEKYPEIRFVLGDFEEETRIDADRFKACYVDFYFYFPAKGKSDRLDDYIDSKKFHDEISSVVKYYAGNNLLVEYYVPTNGEIVEDWE